MRDYAIFLILLALVWAAWLRPWLGVLGLAFLAYMSPQGYSEGFMRTFPMYLTLFSVVCLSIAWDGYRERRLPRPPWDWRLGVFLSLWGWFLFTTYHSQFPWAAWIKFTEVSKVFLALLPTLLLIDTRQKLLYLVAVVAISIGVVTLKGGYWAVMSGFADRVYGSPGGHFHDNNAFAVAMAMNIPLLVLWQSQVKDSKLRWILMGMVLLSYAAILSSWSRGGMITLAVTTLFLLLGTQRKHLALPLLVVGGILAMAVMPEKWFERMETLERVNSIETAQQDQSAAGRMRAWQAGWDYARKHPLTGAGFEGWIAVHPNPENPLDWHSAYVEMLAEHGLVGLGLWSLLLLGSLLSLTVLVWQARRSRAPPWAGDYGAMIRASLAAYMAGSLFLGTAYWDLLYHLIVISILVVSLAHRESVKVTIK